MNRELRKLALIDAYMHKEASASSRYVKLMRKKYDRRVGNIAKDYVKERDFHLKNKPVPGLGTQRMQGEMGTKSFAEQNRAVRRQIRSSADQYTERKRVRDRYTGMDTVKENLRNQGEIYAVALPVAAGVTGLAAGREYLKSRRERRGNKTAAAPSAWERRKEEINKRLRRNNERPIGG